MMFLNNTLRRKVNLIGQILRRNCVLRGAIEGLMMEMKGIGRRMIRLFDYLRNKRTHWEVSKGGN